jgi:nucleotide-binding universal stress UspA family protein
MPGIQNLLVATDFSERAVRAEKRAAMLCAQHNCKTAELMTVREAEQIETLSRLLKAPIEVAKSVIANIFLRELQVKSDGLSHLYHAGFSCTVRFGQPAKEIAARSEEVLADLIVIGAHGGNFLTDLFIGNTADKLIHRCRRPLLIVKNEPASRYQHILVPVDFSEDSRQAAQLAIRIDSQASITFLHAYDVWFEGKMYYAGVSQEAIDHYRIEARETARAAMDKFIDDVNAPLGRITHNVVSGIPSVVVRDYAGRMQPDLIVMGKHGRSRLEELIIGSVTRDTIDMTKCDILIVPPISE